MKEKKDLEANLEISSETLRRLTEEKKVGLECESKMTSIGIIDEEIASVNKKTSFLEECINGRSDKKRGRIYILEDILESDIQFKESELSKKLLNLAYAYREQSEKLECLSTIGTQLKSLQNKAYELGRNREDLATMERTKNDLSNMAEKQENERSYFKIEVEKISRDTDQSRSKMFDIKQELIRKMTTVKDLSQNLGTLKAELKVSAELLGQSKGTETDIQTAQEQFAQAREYCNRERQNVRNIEEKIRDRIAIEENLLRNIELKSTQTVIVDLENMIKTAPDASEFKKITEELDSVARSIQDLRDLM